MFFKRTLSFKGQDVGHTGTEGVNVVEIFWRLPTEDVVFIRCIITISRNGIHW